MIESVCLVFWTWQGNYSVIGVLEDGDKDLYDYTWKWWYIYGTDPRDLSLLGYEELEDGFCLLRVVKEHGSLVIIHSVQITPEWKVG